MTSNSEKGTTEQLSESCIPPSGVRGERRRLSGRIVLGYVLGFVVALGCLLLLEFPAWAPYRGAVLGWGLRLLSGFVGAIVAMAVSYKRAERRKIEPKRLALRLVLLALIYTVLAAVLFVLISLLHILASGGIGS
jgi:Zn-dependent protease